VIGNTGWRRNNKVLRKSHGNRENPVPEVGRTPLTIAQAGGCEIFPFHPLLYSLSKTMIYKVQYSFNIQYYQMSKSTAKTIQMPRRRNNSNTVLRKVWSVSYNVNHNMDSSYTMKLFKPFFMQ
jgi:hypothetical protein